MLNPRKGIFSTDFKAYSVNENGQEQRIPVGEFKFLLISLLHSLFMNVIRRMKCLV